MTRRGGQPDGHLGAIVTTARPRQWIKNLLVLAAPAAAGELSDGDVLFHSAVAFVAFSLAASGVYFVNDARDVAEDRLHPTKRLRPVAAGQLSPRLATAIGGVLLVAGLAVCVLAPWQLAVVLAAYEMLSIAYCLGLKREPVIDIAIIAAGFLLRAVAGGVASDIRLSQWFLLAASFGSLFVASGKRYAEAVMMEQELVATRRSLTRYTATYLRFVWSVSAAILIMTYALWAFQIQRSHDTPWAPISMAPFVLAVLRYAVDIDAGRAGEPEEIALADHVLQALAVIWLVCLLLAVHAR
jgi:decaprenyl-phosphate phosphoribosyltransferase